MLTPTGFINRFRALELYRIYEIKLEAKKKEKKKKKKKKGGRELVESM